MIQVCFALPIGVRGGYRAGDAASAVRHSARLWEGRTTALRSLPGRAHEGPLSRCQTSNGQRQPGYRQEWAGRTEAQLKSDESLRLASSYVRSRDRSQVGEPRFSRVLRAATTGRSSGALRSREERGTGAVGSRSRGPAQSGEVVRPPSCSHGRLMNARCRFLFCGSAASSRGTERRAPQSPDYVSNAPPQPDRAAVPQQ